MGVMVASALAMLVRKLQVEINKKKIIWILLVLKDHNIHKTKLKECTITHKIYLVLMITMQVVALLLLMIYWVLVLVHPQILLNNNNL